MGLGIILKIAFVVIVCIGLISIVKQSFYGALTAFTLTVILTAVWAFNRKKLHP